MSRASSLGALFDGLPPAIAARTVTALALDSRRAARGGLFLAVAGRRGHGLDHLGAALDAGVAAVAWEPDERVVAPQLPEGVAGFAVPGLGSRSGAIADRFFGAPSAALAVTGITGTNGKTTTAWLAALALSAAGRPAGYVGTLGAGFPPELEPAALTTPDCVELHRQFGAFVDAGAAHAVAEVSSHALDQRRVAGVRFAVAAFTNLGRDHLDYHGDMARYGAAKARLFLDTGVPRAVVNLGDRFGRELAGRLPAGTELLGVALYEASPPLPGVRLLGRLGAVRRDGLGLTLDGDFGRAELASPLWGRFNAENLLVATGILLAHGLALDAAVAALSHCPAPPGRLERVGSRPDRPAVVVDFAHTPDALGHALDAVREHVDGQLWCVFGCGGERDAGKRPLMGAIAAARADRVVLTDDNPRHESPEAIIAGIRTGIDARGRVSVIRDREAAIRFAVASARPGDAVLIAGKGAETRQWIGDAARPFSDSAVARAALEARG